MHHAPEIWCFVFRRDPRGYLHILRQSFRGPLALLVDVAPGRQFACIAITEWVVPLGFANLDEVYSLISLSHPLADCLYQNSIPYLIRFRQCLAEYRAPLNRSRRPLYNAIKYATSFPVIYLSAAQRIVVSDLATERGSQVRNEPWHGEHQLFRLWWVPPPSPI